MSAIVDALLQIGICGLTVADARSTSSQRHAVSYRGDEYTVAYIPRVEVQIAVNDEECSEAIKAILEVARRVTSGENRISVLPIEAAYRIRTGTTDYRRETLPA